jgi:hypothetical protein
MLFAYELAIFRPVGRFEPDFFWLALEIGKIACKARV